MSFDFTNQYISQSYQRVLQTDGSKVYDGTGSLAILEYSGSFTGDFTFAFEESPLTNTKVSVYLDPSTGKVSYADDADNLRTIEASAPSDNVRRVRNKLIEVINGGINITGSNPDTFKVIGPSQFTGSVRVDGEVSASIFSGSFVGDGSGLTNLNIDTGSFTTNSSFNSFTSSFNSFTSSIQSEVDNLTAQTGSYATTGSNQFDGNQTITGSVQISGNIKLDPSPDPDPTGADLDSTAIFQSSSNTSLGYDLYIRQNGNLVKWKWVEGIMNTGLLYGGIVTYSGSDVYVSSGSGIIVDHNATSGSEIHPLVTYVNWSNITQSIANISTQQVTYLYIDENGTLQQQSTRFTPQQYHQYIPLGAVGHFDFTQVSAFGGQVQTAYDQVSQISTFVDAFGPLKISGYGITGQAGTLGISVGSGTSFIHGGFYENAPEFPSTITTSAQSTASIAYVFTSGSTTRFDTNGGTLYNALRPGWYNPGTGNTGSVSNNDWTIQRAYSDPKTGVVYIYYGETIYSDFDTALADLATDPFTEGDTFDFTTFIGFLVLKSNTTDITETDDNQIVPAGLFRGISAGGGGGALTGIPTVNTSSFVTTSSFNNFTSSYNSGSFSGSFVGDGSGLSGVGSSLDYSPAARIWFLG